MKKSIIISLISLQVLILVGVATTAYFTFMNKARIRATQHVMVDTQDRLNSTFEFMDKVAEQNKKAEEVNNPLSEGSKAPTFALKNENSQEVKLEDYKGKKTLLVFSQESCGYCQKFYPVINKFQAQQEDVNVVIMQIGSTPEQNKKYKQKESIAAPLLAASYEQLTAYKIKVTPTSVLLDEEGKVLGTKNNVSKLEELISFVKESCKDCEVKS
jgi:methylamine dehydrogenase accessory protein MauD